MKIPGINGEFTKAAIPSASEAYHDYKLLIESRQFEDIRIKQRKGKAIRRMSPEKLEKLARQENWKVLMS